MKGLERSFEKFNYSLRPAKQVERRILVYILSKLKELGYPVSEYTYVGMGSVYFTDFILFHRYLLIDEMVCVESADIPNRMNFNKPYFPIKIWPMSIEDAFARLNRDKRYVLWVDYDSSITMEKLNAIGQFLRRLAPGSIFLITLDGKPRHPKAEKDEVVSTKERERALLAYLKKEFSEYLPKKVGHADVRQEEYPRLLHAILKEKFKDVMVRRQDLEFLPLFNYVYKDGATMYSYGGIIDTVAAIRRNSQAIGSIDHVAGDAPPIRLSVPPLTSRERLWLDQNICKGRKPPRIPFEIDESIIADFERIYRHYPNFFESVL